MCPDTRHLILKLCEKIEPQSISCNAKATFSNRVKLELPWVSAIRSLFLLKFTDFCKKQAKKCVLPGQMDFEANFLVQKVAFGPNLLNPYLLVHLGGSNSLPY